MNQQTWNKVSEILSVVLDLEDPAEQDRQIEAHCAGDPELRAAVLSLLRAYRASGAMEEPAIRPVHRISPGDQIGVYRIKEEIGRGGMGIVYLAQRSDGQFERSVAIKVISEGLHSPGSAARFKAEKRILGRLRHAHVVAILDAGVTTQNLPYLVMEYIEGQPLTDYCRTRPLRESLLLFADVCRAVHYAHQQLILHRDLKPANILVTPAGEPKLLDFGVSKLLDPEAADEDRTVAPLRRLTLNFASPEQVRGEDLTTASDVYSLGVILYCLLTGTKPYDVTDASLANAMRVVSVDPVPPPSEKAAAAAGRLLTGDLDAITLRAMAKASGDRYQSALELAIDLGNHLEGRPVTAKSPNAFYLAQKFVRRNRNPVIAACLLAVLTAAGTYAIFQQSQVARKERDRANARFHEARALANSVLFDYQAQLLKLPGSLSVRKQMMGRALQQMENLRRDSDDPELLLELADAYQRISEVQGGTNWGLGDVEAAWESKRTAKQLLERLSQLRPQDRRPRIQLGQLLNSMAQARGQQRGEADELVGQAFTHWSQLYRLDPNDPYVMQGYAGSLFLKTRNADNKTAIALLTECIDVQEKILSRNPKSAEVIQSLALSHKYITMPAFRVQGSAVAIVHTKRALELDRMRLTMNPTDPRIKLDYSFSLSTLASMYAETKDNRALDLFREVVRTRRELLAAEPQNNRLSGSLISALYTAGRAQVALGAAPEGHRNLAEALRLLTALKNPTATERETKADIEKRYPALRKKPPA